MVRLAVFLPFCFMASTVLPMIAAEAAEAYLPKVSDLDADSKLWFLAGNASANYNVDAFAKIALKIINGQDVNGDVKKELEKVSAVAETANDNTITLVPRLQKLVNSIYDWSREDGLVNKLKLKAFVALAARKRDNKSYFLQNAAGFWFDLRNDEYLSQIPQPNAVGQKLYNDFDTLGQSCYAARDALDASAQIFVTAMKKLDVLVRDIGKNREEIQNISAQLKTEMDSRSPGVLSASQKCADDISNFSNTLA